MALSNVSPHRTLRIDANMVPTSQARGQRHREITQHVQNHTGTQQRWDPHIYCTPIPSSREQSEASGHFSATGWQSCCESFSHPESSFNPPLSRRHIHRLTDTMADISVSITSHMTSMRTHDPRRTPETYRDEDGLIKQFQGRVKYVEEKSLLIQNGEGGEKISVSDP